jgi:3'(2'), 5'-bisphosphate nucleotidase
MTDRRELLDKVVALAREAGDAVMPIYAEKELDVSLKDDEIHSPLTQADLTANQIILDGLHRLTSDIPIVSEEALIPDAERLAARRFWLVDPIDGTKEFIKKNGQFTVNIGLVEHGEPVLGAVYAPAMDLLYCGGKGLGAWKTSDGATNEIRVADGSRPPVAVGSLSHPSPAAAEWLNKQGITDVVSTGSSLKVCYVAEGTADVYPRIDAHLSDWDIAAADAVLRAAGGVCEVFDTGEPLRYDRAELRLPHFLIRSSAFTVKR